MDVDEPLPGCLSCHNLTHEPTIICSRSMMMHYELGPDSCYIDDMHGEDSEYSLMYHQLADTTFGIFREATLASQSVIK